MPLLLERASDPFEVIDLAVRHERDASILALERLGSRFGVEHGKARVQQRDSGSLVHKGAAIVRPAVMQHPQNALHSRLWKVATDRAEDAAHAAACAAA